MSIHITPEFINQAQPPELPLSLTKSEPLIEIKNEPPELDEEIISDIKEVDIVSHLLCEDSIKSESVAENVLETKHSEFLEFERQVFVKTENDLFVKIENLNENENVYYKTEDTFDNSVNKGTDQEIVEVQDIIMPKTTAGRVRECKPPKKLLKQKPPPKTGAQRIREYRARVNALGNDAVTSTSFSGLHELHTVDPKTSQPSTSKDDGIIVYWQPQVLDDAKTTAERVGECRVWKQLLKLKPPAKTPAQRSREYRARLKALRNGAATIGDNKTASTSFSGLHEIHTVDPNTPQPSTSRNDGNVLYTGQPQVFDDAKTTAERVGECSALKQLLTQKPPAKTAAQRCREYRARKKLLKQKSQKPPAKTSAQCSREYRARKKLLKQKSQMKTEAKTAAQRSREYRARRKAFRNAAATIGENETPSTSLHTVDPDTPQPSTSSGDSNTSILYKYLSQTSGQAGQSQVVQADQANSFQRVVNPNLIPTRTGKLCAQQSREYRRRKKAIVPQRPVINVSSNVSDIQVDPDLHELHTVDTPQPSTSRDEGPNENVYALNNFETHEQLVFNLSTDLTGIGVMSTKPEKLDFAKCYRTCKTISWEEDKAKIKVIKAPLIRIEPHQYSSLAEDMYFCNACHRVFTKLMYVKRHIRKMHMGVTQLCLCPYCPFKSKCKGVVRGHIIQRHKDTKDIQWFQCHLCEKKFKLKSAMIEHTKVHLTHEQMQDRMRFCPVCGKGFKRGHTVIKHIQLVHNKVERKCEECEYRTTNSQHLKHHIKNSHEKHKKRFYCEKCVFGTGQYSRLKIHELTHKTEAEMDDQDFKYRCNKCDYKTYRHENFKRHKSIHLKPEEIQYFYCYHCSYKSKQKSGLQTHIVRHFKKEEVDFHCYICDFMTPKRDLIIEHIGTHSKVQIKSEINEGN